MFEIQERETIEYWRDVSQQVFGHDRVWEHVSWHSRIGRARALCDEFSTRSKNLGCYEFRIACLWGIVILEYIPLRERNLGMLILFAILILAFFLGG